MSLVATRNIEEGEEILVNYNYDVASAPLWYKEEWKAFQAKKKTDSLNQDDLL